MSAIKGTLESAWIELQSIGLLEEIELKNR